MILKFNQKSRIYLMMLTFLALTLFALSSHPAFSVNAEQQMLEINVRDGLTNEPFPAILTIYRADGTLVQTLNTGAEGKVSIDLPAGQYYVKVKVDIFIDTYVEMHTSSTINLEPNTTYTLNIYIFFGKYIGILTGAFIGLLLGGIGSYVACKARHRGSKWRWSR